jgi:hypothetical protein
MIIINLIGGLGNQMFQYAAAKALALQRKETLKLNTTAFETYTLHQYGLHHFAIADSKVNFLDKIKSKLFKTKQYTETNFEYNPNVQQLKAQNIILNGYFQSEKYFGIYRKELLELFEIKTELKQQTKDLLKQISNQNAVALHIRRGDYLQNTIHNTDKTDYYKKAIHYISEKVKNPIFYIFSDDMGWVKDHFKINFETHYVDFNDANTNFEDLKLMSSCQHNIIANSSFSWWSAWLNVNPDKIVIAPKKWFATGHYNSKDVLPQEWVKL